MRAKVSSSVQTSKAPTALHLLYPNQRKVNYEQRPQHFKCHLCHKLIGDFWQVNEHLGQWASGHLEKGGTAGSTSQRDCKMSSPTNMARHTALNEDQWPHYLCQRCGFRGPSGEVTLLVGHTCCAMSHLTPMVDTLAPTFSEPSGEISIFPALGEQRRDLMPGIECSQLSIQLSAEPRACLMAQ